MKIYTILSIIYEKDESQICNILLKIRSFYSFQSRRTFLYSALKDI